MFKKSIMKFVFCFQVLLSSVMNFYQIFVFDTNCVIFCWWLICFCTFWETFSFWNLETYFQKLFLHNFYHKHLSFITVSVMTFSNTSLTDFSFLLKHIFLLLNFQRRIFMILFWIFIEYDYQLICKMQSEPMPKISWKSLHVKK